MCLIEQVKETGLREEARGSSKVAGHWGAGEGNVLPLLPQPWVSNL